MPNVGVAETFHLSGGKYAERSERLRKLATVACRMRHELRREGQGAARISPAHPLP